MVAHGGRLRNIMLVLKQERLRLNLKENHQEDGQAAEQRRPKRLRCLCPGRFPSYWTKT